MAMVALGMVPRGKDGRTTIRFETDGRPGHQRGRARGRPRAAGAGSRMCRPTWRLRTSRSMCRASARERRRRAGAATISASSTSAARAWRSAPIPARGCRRSASPRARCCARKIKLQHPTQGHVSNFNFVTLWHEGRLPGAFYKNVHVFSAGQLDRSPGGTGTSAMMAMFHARGKLGLNQPIKSEGLVGTGTFEGCLIGETHARTAASRASDRQGQRPTSSARRAGSSTATTRSVQGPCVR